MDRATALDGLESGVPEKMCETLVSLALNDSDWRWVQDRCLDLALHPEASVRASSATCLGHLARIHRELELERVLPILRRLLEDPRTKGYAETALDDVKTFLGDALASSHDR